MKRLLILIIFICCVQLVKAQCSWNMTIIYNNPTCYLFNDGSITVNLDETSELANPFTSGKIQVVQK